MKHLRPLMAILAILSLHFVTNAQDGGQRLRISQGNTVLGTYGLGETPHTASPPSLSITNLSGLTFESLDSTTQTVGNAYCADSDDGNCGWYKASWIFGDGNYKFFPQSNSTMDLASKTITGYRYAKSDQYGPIVYLTEKYHNKRPPGSASASITVNYPPNTTLPPYQELTKRLATTPNRRIDIDYNHEPRVDYPFNMVLSYRKDEPITTVYYYYNSLFNNQLYSLTSTRLVQYVKTEETNYQRGRLLTSVDDSAFFRDGSKDSAANGNLSPEGNLLDLLIPKFESRLVYDVREISKDQPSGLTEFRLFPVFQTLGLDKMPNGLLVDTPMVREPAFAAIIVGQDSLSGTDFQGLIATANFLFGTNLNSLQLGPNDPRFIRGIQLLNLPMKASHDPNSLVVTKIDTLSGGQYNVTFKLRVCNEGLGMEHSPTLTFRDLTNGHYGAKPVLSAEIFDNTTNLDTTWKFVGNRWSVNLDGFTIVGLAPKMIDSEEHFVPSCRTIIYSILTDETGVNRLYQDSPRALEVCVTFSAGAGDCTDNEALTKETPPTPQPIPCENGLLFYLLVGVIALILWWYFLWRNAA